MSELQVEVVIPEVIAARTTVELGVADAYIDGLRERLSGVSADTTTGYQIVKAGISEVRTIRTGVDKSRKELKVSALEWCAKVESEAKRVIYLLREIENPLIKEKKRVDDEVARLRREAEEKERLEALAIKREEREEAEAKELAERNALKADEEAAREAQRKELEEAATKLAEATEAVEADRRKLAAEWREQQQTFAEDQEKLRIDRRKVESREQAIKEKDRVARDAREAVEQEARDIEEHAKAELRVAEKLVEQKRLEDERKPDREKLADFGDALDDVKVPELKTDWGKSVLKNICEHLMYAIDGAHHQDYTPTDGLVAAAAAETVTDQTP